MGRSSRTSIGAVALVAIGLVAVLAAPGGAEIPPPAHVRLSASSVRQGGTVTVRTSNNRCGVAVSRPGVDSTSVVGQISLVDGHTGAVLSERRVRASESSGGVLNAGLRVPSVLAAGTYLVHAACFNSSFELATYFSPAPLTVLPMIAGRPLGPPTVTPSTIAVGTVRSVAVSLPAACDASGRKVHLDILMRRFDAVGTNFPFEVEPVVPALGRPTVATISVGGRFVAAGRYHLQVTCRTLSFDRFTAYEPATIVVGAPPAATAGRLSVTPTTVAAGANVVVRAACEVDTNVTVFHRQTGEVAAPIGSTGTSSTRGVKLPLTLGAGQYLVRASCAQRAFLPVIITVTAAPAPTPARPVTTVSPQVVDRGRPFVVRVDRRYCRPAVSSVSFPVNAQRAVLVQRSTGVKVAERSWNFVNTGFSFSTTGRAAGMYLLFVSCREVGVGDSYFEPMVVVIR